MTMQTWLVVLTNGKCHRFDTKKEAEHFVSLFPEEQVRGVWEDWIQKGGKYGSKIYNYIVRYICGREFHINKNNGQLLLS